MSEENIENMTKLDTTLAVTFGNHYVLPDINFNGHYLINKFFIPKKEISKYFLHTNSVVKKSKHRFYIK